MIKIFYLIVCLFFFTANSFSQTQAEMYQTAIKDYKKVDEELNKVYNQLIKTLNPKEKKLLITAQKSWIKFRDSHCAFEAEEFNGGSIQPLIIITCKNECTQKRIEELNSSSSSNK